MSADFAAAVGTVLVLIGQHGAGKSTLGARIAAELGVPFDDEIGRRLRDEALAADPGAHALVADANFDLHVVARELARDADRGNAPRVVETWHPGNLGYAAVRSPAVTAGLLVQLHAHGLAGAPHIVVQPLSIDRDTARARFTEPVPDSDAALHFFELVAVASAAWARCLGWRVLPAIDTGRVGVDACVAEIVGRLNSTGRAPGYWQA